nr:MAG: site-2 protease family protein [Caldicoprobacter oshimai]
MYMNWIDVLLSLPAVFLAISFHEFAHALTAYWLGDPTPKNQGRLTLYPLAHVDWLGLILFALFRFGWAKPVQVNPANFKDRKWGSIIVSFSGPLANMLLSLVALVILVAAKLSISSYRGILLGIIDRVVQLNIIFAILNLIPIPPFDGYHIIKGLFYRRNVRFFWNYEYYGMFILFAFVLLGGFNLIVRIPAQYIYQQLMYLQSFLLSLLQ